MLRPPSYRDFLLYDLMATAREPRISAELLREQTASDDCGLARDAAVAVADACESEIVRRSAIAWSAWALGEQG